MPLFDESMAFAGLSNQSDMSGFITKPVLHYSGPYFSYHSRGKDAAELTSPWTNSSASLLDAKCPTTHASGAETSSNLSGQSDSPVHIAIPKAVYGHNPCYHGLGCVMGHRYTAEHRAQAADSADFDSVRAPGEAYQSQRSPIHQKARDALQGFQLDPREEQVKRMTAENMNRGRPARMEQTYSGFPSLSPLSMLTLGEQGRHLQPSPGGYAGLPPSHTTHEHMTSELYQECSPMSKYGHPTKHSMFYYPRGNVEVENRTYCHDIGGKQREDIRKSQIPIPREHYTLPRALNGDIPLFLHGTETHPSHSFVQGFDYPCYAHPGFHLSPVSNVERQHIQSRLPSQRMNFSPSDPLEASHPIQQMDPISPMRRAGQFVLPSHIEMSRLYPSITSRPIHQMDEPVLSPSALAKEQYSYFVDQVSCLKDLAVFRGTRLPHSLKTDSDHLCTTLSHRPNSQTVIVTGNKHSRRPHNPSTSVHKGSLKRHIKEEALDLCETEMIKKRQKLEMEEVLIRNQEGSPEMPVIDSVFSLAPKEYIKTSGVPEVEPLRRALVSESCQVKPTTPLTEIKPDPAGSPAHVCAETPEVQMIEPAKIKVENISQSDIREATENPPSQAACSTIQDQNNPQAEDATSSDTKSMLVIQICEPEGFKCKTSSLEDNDPSLASEPPSVHSVDSSKTPQEQEVANEPKPVSPLRSIKPKFHIKNIPPEYLKPGSNYNIRLPDLKLLCPVVAQETPEQIRPELSPRREKPIRKHFLELHRTLLKHVAKCVFATSEQQLSTWRSQLGLDEPSSNKVQKVSCLLGMKARHMWFNEEIKSALLEVQDRLREYIIHKRCPFPHVMRTGAVFIPMLVVKEILFPIVPGTFIDQVLQEHKVELRPTTLSEEKILAQLHKPCSSRLGRLMSLKHLPNIYTDVLNLFYYSSVCKHLGVDVDVLDCSDFSGGSLPPENSNAASSHVRSTTKTKSRIKSSCRRLFLDSRPSEDEDEKESGKKAGNEETSPPSLSKTPSDDSWTRPLMFEDFPGSDVEPDESTGFPPVCLPAQTAMLQMASQNSSGSVIKLKNRQSHKQGEHSRMTFKWRRTGSSGRTLRPVGGSRIPKKRLLKIKYCPYLSACHSAERRRRWVLRSAVQRASGASGQPYPDLVGKRIRHLYEELDKSEVWYRGEVLCVHEANSDPLKTIFEVCYDSEPEWKYYLELLTDYKKGWLIVEEDNPKITHPMHQR
ncbi:uncharacterized protein C15orf39 homolog [Corythoichthys intestinalis]|uniref:uncharacterized protein C15orf39 homolog n=1 Tax=Corythoichthys intestinalis TaxID=161448 RepID=UPI0025A55570|nr:uncharacterized protein C15orf39 homolog [Corythoichthys intestinalis]